MHLMKKIKVHVSYLRLPHVNVCTGQQPIHLNKNQDLFFFISLRGKKKTKKTT